MGILRAWKLEGGECKAVSLVEKCNTQCSIIIAIREHNYRVFLTLLRSVSSPVGGDGSPPWSHPQSEQGQRDEDESCPSFAERVCAASSHAFPSPPASLRTWAAAALSPQLGRTHPQIEDLATPTIADNHIIVFTKIYCIIVFTAIIHTPQYVHT